jgi:hypothetical protein
VDIRAAPAASEGPNVTNGRQAEGPDRFGTNGDFDQAQLTGCRRRHRLDT